MRRYKFESNLTTDIGVSDKGSLLIECKRDVTVYVDFPGNTIEVVGYADTIAAEKFDISKYSNIYDIRPYYDSVLRYGKMRRWRIPSNPTGFFVASITANKNAILYHNDGYYLILRENSGHCTIEFCKWATGLCHESLKTWKV